MLQRAAIHAHSWWWASHTRTKQAKRLSQDMHDMEEKVEYILKIINEEGDSFAVRAEMYYRKRPELVNFVEDCFRNYRALAERYDHLSKEFQSANRTIATVFPERVQMAMEELDDENLSASNFFQETKQLAGESPVAPPNLTIPAMVGMIKKKSKAPSRMMSRKGLLKINSTDNLITKSSGLTKEEALREIDKLQKGILGFQTEKEFLKSTIENVMTKCCDLENQVTEMQARVSGLEDEFGIGTVIEDDEARSIMASSAIKSCKETLVKLQAKQEQTSNEALVEHRRVKDAGQKFETIKGKLSTNQTLPKQENPSNQPVPIQRKFHYQSVPGEHKSPNPSPNEDNETQDPGPAEQNSLPSLRRVNQMTQSGRESPNPSPNQTVLDEHDHPTSSSSLSNQTILIEPNYPHSGSCPSNRAINDKHTNLNSNQTILDEESNPNSGNQMVSSGHKNPNPSNHVYTIEDSSSNQSNQTIQIEDIHSNSNTSNQTVHTEDRNSDQSSQMVPLEQKSPNQCMDSKHAASSKDCSDNLSLVSNPDLRKSAGKEKDDEILMAITKDQILGNTVCDLAENIDDIVDKVINLEIEVNSQSGLVRRLRSETDHLQDHISSLEEGEEGLNGSLDKKMRKLSEVEQQLCDIRSLDQSVIDQNKNLEARVGEVSSNLDILSEKIPTVKQNEESEIRVSFKEESVVPQIQEREDDLPHKGQVRAVLEGIQEQRSKETEHTNDLKKDRSTGQKASAKSQINGHLGLKENGDEDREIDNKKNQNQIDQENDLMAKNQDSVNETGTDEDDQPNWRKLFLGGLDDGERTLVEEYTSLLGNFKQIKKKLSEVENKNRANNFRNIVQIKVLKSANASKDEEIKELNKKLNLFIAHLDENSDSQESSDEKNADEKASDESSRDSQPNPPKKLSKKRVRFLMDLLKEQGRNMIENADESDAESSEDKKESSAIEEPHVPSIEEKIRMEIDDLLEENIEFWLRFSTSVHQIKKFQSSFQDLQEEFEKVMGNRSGGNNTSDSDLRAIYKHLREIETELTLYLEHNGILRDDLQHRLVSICTIQEELTSLSEHTDESVKSELNDYQTAKFQGEVTNMKQENSKVTSELLTSLDRGRRLKIDIEKTMEKINDELGISTKTKNANAPPRSKIPLRSFLFGVKLKKQKPSFFACISPQLQRQYSDLSGMPI